VCMCARVCLRLCGRVRGFFLPSVFASVCLSVCLSVSDAFPQPVPHGYAVGSRMREASSDIAWRGGGGIVRECRVVARLWTLTHTHTHTPHIHTQHTHTHTHTPHTQAYIYVQNRYARLWTLSKSAATACWRRLTLSYHRSAHISPRRRSRHKFSIVRRLSDFNKTKIGPPVDTVIVTSSGFTVREPQQNPVLVFSITLKQKRVRPPVWIILVLHAELASVRAHLLVKGLYHSNLPSTQPG
jgi:hypothetical protein